MRLRLILSFVLVVVVAITSVLLIARQGVASEVHTFMARGGMMGMDSLADDLESFYLQTNSWQGADEVLKNARMGGGMGMMMGSGPWLRVADPEGQVVADNRAKANGRLSSSELEAAIPLQDSGGELIGYLIAVGGEFNSEQDLIESLARAGWIAAAVSGALALLLALVLSYTLIKPVEDLTRAAVRMAGGDLSQRVAVRSKDEMGVLGSAFNHMAASLEEAGKNRQAMTADIAHELRTPIAIQRAHLEALQDGIYPLTAENLQPVLDQTELLARLVEDLRTLALADAGALKLEIVPTDFAGLVRRVIDRFRPEADMRGIQLSQEEVEDHILQNIPMDAGRVEQILNNLLSNALRYTPAGGTVRLTLKLEDGWSVLQVVDNGPGIPPEALPSLFERFYRVDKSRSREAGGTGLGLAIARQLALAHGGNITAANRPEGGAVFTLRIPASK